MFSSRHLPAPFHNAHQRTRRSRGDGGLDAARGLEDALWRSRQVRWVTLRYRIHLIPRHICRVVFLRLHDARFRVDLRKPDGGRLGHGPAVEIRRTDHQHARSALDSVRSVDGVLSRCRWPWARRMRGFRTGGFRPFQIIGVDDATLSGVPRLRDGASPTVLRSPDAAIVDPGGTEGKLETPLLKADQWPTEPHLNAPTRPLSGGR